MKRNLQLEVVGRNKADAGFNYILSLVSFDTFNIGDKLTVTYNTGLTREDIISGIYNVFGFGLDELYSKASDTQHTYARKVYAHLRREMGISVGDIAHELKKANASVAYYLTDNSTKLKEYCEAVRNG